METLNVASAPLLGEASKAPSASDGNGSFVDNFYKKDAEKNHYMTF